MNDSNLAQAVMDTAPIAIRFFRNEVKRAQRGELAYSHYRILAYLSRSTATNREIAEWQGVSFPAMSRMVDGLVKRALVSRETCAEDRRQIRLRLTVKGQAIHFEMTNHIHEELMRRLGRIPAERKNALLVGLQLLQKIFG